MLLISNYTSVVNFTSVSALLLAVLPRLKGSEKNAGTTLSRILKQKTRAYEYEHYNHAPKPKATRDK